MITPHAGMNLTDSVKLLEAAMSVCRTESGRQALWNAHHKAKSQVTVPPDTILALAGEILAQGPAVVDAQAVFIDRQSWSNARETVALAVVDAGRDFIAGRTHTLTAAALIAEIPA